MAFRVQIPNVNRPTTTSSISFALSLLLVLLLPTSVWATVYVVNPEGTGDFPTIQAALDAVVDGDIVELTDGVFEGPGNVEIDFGGKAVTVTSQNGAAHTRIRCGGSRGFVFDSQEGPGAVLAAVTINLAYAYEGGAILIQSAGPTIADCVFQTCWAEFNGGAIRCQYATPLISGCAFHDCTAGERGGAIYSDQASDLTLTECLFDHCSAPLRAGAVYVAHSPATMTDCIFQYNSAFLGGAVGLNNHTAEFTRCTFYTNETGSRGGGGAIWACDKLGTPILTQCTLYDNEASGDNGAIYLNGGSQAYLHNTIIAFNRGLAILCVDTATADLYCCDVYGNTSGDWVGYIADQLGVEGNICANPLFCDTSTATLEIQSNSPCAPFTPPNPECDLIGAWPVGCEPPPPFAILSITDVGNDQGRRVRLRWARQPNDRPGTDTTIAAYTLWRRIDPLDGGGERQLSGSAARPSMTQGRDRSAPSCPQSQWAEASQPEHVRGPGAMYPPGEWDFVKEVPACYEETYSTLCETLCDSTVWGGICWSVFFVRAEGSCGGSTFFIDTAPDSGYSVDNLAPGPPTGLHYAGPALLVWDPSSVEDFDYFSVYGSDEAHLTPEAVLLGYAVDPVMDVGGQDYAYFHVTATDFAGNEGEEATVGAYASVSENPRPGSVRLHGAQPSPGPGWTAIRFELPRQAHVELRIYDASGRQVADLVDRPMAPGAHSILWDGRVRGGEAASPGIFFCRLRAEGETLTRRVALTAHE